MKGHLRARWVMPIGVKITGAKSPRSHSTLDTFGPAMTSHAARYEQHVGCHSPICRACRTDPVLYIKRRGIVSAACT